MPLYTNKGERIGKKLFILLSQQVDSAAVPFEFSPGLGLLLVGSLFGCNHLYRKHKAGKIIK